MKTVQLNLEGLDLEIDFDFEQAEPETRDEPATLESVYIYTIRLACNGWEQDNIPYKHVTIIKEMLLQRDYVEVINSPVTDNLNYLFGDILNPTK